MVPDRFNNAVITASAPGNLMLLGEHAVLHGSQALVLAVDKRMRVRLEPRQDQLLKIESALGEYQQPLDQLSADSRFGFVLAAIELQAERLPSGLTLRIESDFSHTVGLGSSAAVTVATLAALNFWVSGECDHQQLFEQARSVMLSVQGRGSGADLAAAVEGGMVAYRQTGERSRLSALPRVGLYYSGYKLKTPEVLRRVASAQQQQPQLYDSLYQLMSQCADQAVAVASQGDWPELGRLMNLYQGLMDALGVNDAKLSQMIYQLRADDRVEGAKISGSGLGDCVISLGLPSDDSGLEAIAVQVSERGVEVGFE